MCLSCVYCIQYLGTRPWYPLNHATFIDDYSIESLAELAFLHKSHHHILYAFIYLKLITSIRFKDVKRSMRNLVQTVLIMKM